MTIVFSTTSTSAYSGNEIEGTFTRGQDFEQSVTVSVPSTETETFTVTDIEVQLLGDEEPIDITVSVPTINFDGTYFSGWDDVFTYVPPGESDKTVDPVSVNLTNLPDGQDLYDLDQDQKHFVSRDYSVTVTYTTDSTGAESTETVTLTHEVFNDLEAIRSFMANYDYGEG